MQLVLIALEVAWLLASKLAIFIKKGIALLSLLWKSIAVLPRMSVGNVEE